MALVTFGRTPKFDLVTPKQFVWFRDFQLATAVTATKYAGYPLQMDTAGNLTNYVADGTTDAFILFTDTNRDDVAFGNSVTVLNNDIGFTAKVHSDFVSGTPAIADKIGWSTSLDKYLTVSSASTATSGYRTLAVVQAGNQGGWYTFRFLPVYLQKTPGNV